MRLHERSLKDEPLVRLLRSFLEQSVQTVEGDVAVRVAGVAGTSSRRASDRSLRNVAGPRAAAAHMSPDIAVPTPPHEGVGSGEEEPGHRSAHLEPPIVEAVGRPRDGVALAARMGGELPSLPTYGGSER